MSTNCNGHIAHAAMENIAGQDAANRLLHDLRRTSAHPDALHDALQAVPLTREPERLRAWCRTIQKRLESQP